MHVTWSSITCVVLRNLEALFSPVVPTAVAAKIRHSADSRDAFLVVKRHRFRQRDENHDPSSGLLSSLVTMLRNGTAFGNRTDLETGLSSP